MGAEGEKKENEREESRPRPEVITQDQFVSWKRSKSAEASARNMEAARKRAEDIIAGTVPMNGRELFLHEPSVFDNARY